MMRTGVQRESTWRTSLGRIAAVAVAIGGLSVSTFALSTAAGAITPTTATEISTAKNAKLGTILVSDNGDTVYTLKPSKTACTAACLKAWPPVLLPQGMTAATAGTGVGASKLGTKPAADGALQVTYSGKPLYWFSKDKAAGQVHGNVTDKWGKWATVVTAKSGSGSAPGTTNPGTGGTSF